jgi:predicted ABC-type transport system involved in lysophospholipase L1 biosynthesis ATPase subunit
MARLLLIWTGSPCPHTLDRGARHVVPARLCMSLSPAAPASPGLDLVIRTRDLAKSYGRGSALVHALRGVSIDVRRGERVALLGKSGSGKSTLLNLLGGLDRPTSGRAEVAGQDLARLSSAQLARHRLAVVGMVFQSFNLIGSRTALDNVILPQVFAGRPPRQRQETARRMLDAVGLASRLHHRPAELSGGEQQRVALARALVNGPQVLITDEPTGSLDSQTAAEVMALLTEHVRSSGATLLLVTHDEDLARRSTERVIRLHDGQVVP